MSQPNSNPDNVMPPFHPWRSRWIWTPHVGPNDNIYAAFRREFEIADPSGCVLRIAADFRYRLWVNGELVGDGPPPGHPGHCYYDERDLSEYLVAGDNAIGIVVRYSGLQQGGRGGLLAELCDAEGEAIVGTDAAWKSLAPTPWIKPGYRSWVNRFEPDQEFYDARHFPEGWTCVGFEDSQWVAAEIVNNPHDSPPPRTPPWLGLRRRDIPFMNEDTLIYPHEVVRVERSLSLENRMHPEDLSINLSRAGIDDTQHVVVENLDNLIGGQGVARLGTSTEHLRDICSTSALMAVEWEWMVRDSFGFFWRSAARPKEPKTCWIFLGHDGPLAPCPRLDS